MCVHFEDLLIKSFVTVNYIQVLPLTYLSHKMMKNEAVMHVCVHDIIHCTLISGVQNKSRYKYKHVNVSFLINIKSL